MTKANIELKIPSANGLFELIDIDSDGFGFLEDDLKEDKEEVKIVIKKEEDEDG